MAGELGYDPVTGQLVYSPATGQLALDCCCVTDPCDCDTDPPGNDAEVTTDTSGACHAIGTYTGYDKIDYGTYCHWIWRYDNGVYIYRLRVAYFQSSGTWSGQISNDNYSIAYYSQIPISGVGCVDSRISGEFDLVGGETCGVQTAHVVIG